ncbi:MAG: phosphatidate cytidylyltransferase [Bacteroidetes bacterium]|nr:phosphatidate cytidylyltransferase [Bacteroidota bacterium]
MNNFATRTITGAIFVILIIASILIHPIFFSVVFLAFCILGIIEFYTIICNEAIIPQRYIGITISILLFVISSIVAITNTHFYLFYLLIPLLFLPFLVELFRNKLHPLTNISTTLLGVFYIALPLSLLNFLPNIGFETGINHKGILLGTFILIWTNDTFAYLVGVKFGKNRLFERISPKKSWEGSIGGLIFSLIGGYILSLFYIELSLAAWLGMSVIIVISGTLGDLTESMFKRSLNIKDSGTILPGHGGILDRLDALFIAVPFIFFYLIILNLLR